MISHGQRQALHSFMQVAREVGGDFWTGGCVWFPTNDLDAQVPDGATWNTSGLVAFTLELELCQTKQQHQKSRIVHRSTMYMKWSNRDTSRYSQHQKHPIYKPYCMSCLQLLGLMAPVNYFCTARPGCACPYMLSDLRRLSFSVMRLRWDGVLATRVAIYFRSENRLVSATAQPAGNSCSREGKVGGGEGHLTTSLSC